MIMPVKKVTNHRKLYFMTGYVFLIIVNIIILVLGMVLVFRLLKFF